MAPTAASPYVGSSCLCMSGWGTWLVGMLNAAFTLVVVM
jgi:hypothetical protein